MNFWEILSIYLFKGIIFLENKFVGGEFLKIGCMLKKKKEKEEGRERGRRRKRGRGRGWWWWGGEEDGRGR